MQIESLGAFVTLASYLNFSRAASMMGVSQPALSNKIASVEGELGFKLFERRKPLRLTAQGERFLRCAQQVLDTYREGVEECRRMDERSESIRLLWFELTSHYAPLLAKTRDIPHVMVQPTGTESPFDMIEDGEIDVVAGSWLPESTPEGRELARSMCERGILALPTGSTPGAIAMAKDNPRAVEGALSSEDLRGCCVMIPGASVFEQTTSVIQGILGTGVDVHFGLGPIFGNLRNIDSYNLSRDVICMGRTIIRQYLDDGANYRVYDSIDGKEILFPTAIFYRQGNRNANVARFIACARELFGAGEGGKPR